MLALFLVEFGPKLDANGVYLKRSSEAGNAILCEEHAWHWLK